MKLAHHLVVWRMERWTAGIQLESFTESIQRPPLSLCPSPPSPSQTEVILFTNPFPCCLVKKLFETTTSLQNILLMTSAAAGPPPLTQMGLAWLTPYYITRALPGYRWWRMAHFYQCTAPFRYKVNKHEPHLPNEKLPLLVTGRTAVKKWE